MGQEKRTPRISFGLLALLLAFAPGCKLEDEFNPTGPTGSDAVAGDGATLGSSNGTFGSDGGGNVSAPIISDPLSGTTVSSARPALTVLNAASSGAPTSYLFQVAADPGFGTVVAQSQLVPEGGSGSTTWTVDTALDRGQHFWRARARSGTTDGPFSSTADFNVSSGASPGPEDPPIGNDPSPPPAGTIISDPLIGGSIGEVAGGQFTSAGWTVTAPGNFIRYEVPPMSRGWVEFETSGLRRVNLAPNQFMLFGMWDPSAGPFRANPFRVNIQKLHPNPHNPPYLRMRWISQGEQHDEGNRFFDWIPSRTYQWRLEWGPNGDGHQARVFLDGALAIEVNYSRAYRPNVHFIELGISERGESVVGATYSNFRVGN